jgi:glucosylceramidase
VSNRAVLYLCKTITYKPMKNPGSHFPVFLLTILVNLILSGCSKSSQKADSTAPPVITNPITTPLRTDVSMWLTTADQGQLLTKQNVSLLFTTANNINATIHVDTTVTYQTIDGFGFALTGGSASLINSLNTSQKTSLLKELFSPDSSGIGVSYLRVSLGASDLSSSDFTYDDLPPGAVDTSLAQFNVRMDQTDLIPILRQIIAINPKIKILACPWSAPAWMRTNDNNLSGSGGYLIPQYYKVYANYFVKYVQAMKAQGISIEAVTPQNEPLNEYNNPAMLLSDTAEVNFIANNLGPAFKAAGLSTKIICYDHNCDRPDYPIYVLNNSAANAYVDGSAFHLYAGDVSALLQVHNAFPDKNIYFTEQATFSTGTFNVDLAWHINNLIVGAVRNWSKNVLEWNLASDPNFNPHNSGGCSTCQGAITIGSSALISRNVSYYIVAHASKFVKPGAIRIASDASTSLPNVAFKNIDGSKVLIVLNNSGGLQTFNIAFNGKTVNSTLGNGSVATYIW